MSSTFTLADESTDDRGPSLSSPSAAPWSPGTASAGASSTATTKPSGKQESAEALSYKPLPEKKTRKLTQRQQMKLEKERQAKERRADADAQRLNGSDDDIELPKKPWLTIHNGKRARPDEVAETLSDLAAMLESGQSEKSAVGALATQYANYDIGEAYERVGRLLIRGVTLAKAMADQTDSFPPVVRELIGAANMPEDMHRNLRQAATIVTEGDNIRNQVKGALFKPGFLLFLLLAFLFISVQYLLPSMTNMFSGIGADAPDTMGVILAVGDGVKWGLLVLFSVLLLAAGFWLLFGRRSEKLTTKWDAFVMRAPMVGGIMSMSITARFCDVLSACLAVGMTEIESLEVAARASGNKAVAAWVAEHIGRQRVGVVQFGDVAENDMFPWNFRNRIKTNFSPTRRVEILRELAETFHRKAQIRLTQFAERIGPISEGVVIAAVVVIVLIVISPMLTFIPTLVGNIG